MSSHSLRFSVIMPTYQRCGTVVKSIQALAHQTYEQPFEVIVVVDGSTDNTVEALSKLVLPFPLLVLEQANLGAAAARNNGARQASGSIYLFLDDDMEAHPELLREHHILYDEGTDAVLGHLPLHPDSPKNLLSQGIGVWADKRLERLSAENAELTLHDLLTGQLSVSSHVFQELGGFNTDFTAEGTFGNEDVDFGYRLLKSGYKIVFNPAAISWQRYVVQPRRYLEQWYQAGQADVLFARKYPEQLDIIFDLNNANSIPSRMLWRPLQLLPPLALSLTRVIQTCALVLLRWGIEHDLLRKLFKQAATAGYWLGVSQAGGIPTSKSLLVLTYHAITESGRSTPLEPYCVSPALFQRHIEMLMAAGYHFIGAEELMRFAQGRSGVPHKAVMLTFDDGYTDLTEVVLPLLTKRRIPAVVFAVSQKLGKTNDWDGGKDSPVLRLLDARGLQTLAQHGFEIGAHSRTHTLLTTLSGTELRAEIEGSVTELEQQGLPRPRFFAYPYGESNAEIQQVVAQCSIELAFTVEPKRLRQHRNVHKIPRVEMLSGDHGWRFWWKIFAAGPILMFVYRYQKLTDSLIGMAKQIYRDFQANRIKQNN